MVINDKQSFKWSSDEVKYLISLYEKNRVHFNNPKKTNRSTWATISQELNEAFSTNITWEQCEAKFKNLKKTYKSITDHNNTSGKERKTWPFFDLMDKLFYKDPAIQPLTVTTSGSISSLLNVEESDIDVEVTIANLGKIC